MKRLLYGSLGFISLLGFVGIFTEEKYFLSFFCFAVNFQYFFKKTDEMVDEYMNKSARNGFFTGMLAVAIISTFNMFLKTPYEALNLGILYGWILAVATFIISTMIYEYKEKRSIQYD